jgi:hypothetical protein
MQKWGRPVTRRYADGTAEAVLRGAPFTPLGHLGVLLVAKAALVVIVVIAVAGAERRYPLAGALVATIAVVAGLVGAWSNVLTLDAMR